MRYNTLYNLVVLFFFSASLLQPQSINSIKNSDAYYWGEAVSENVRVAEDHALSDMMNKIAVNVAASFERNVTESSDGITEQATKILQTYSTATLKNVEALRVKEGDKFRVLRYIEKSEVQAIFNERIKLVNNIFHKAEEFFSEDNLGDALKYFYYALILMNSVPEQNIHSGSINLKTEIPSRIKNIINSISLQVIDNKMLDDKERQLVLDVTASKKNVNNLDFTFWDGNNQIEVAVKDGKCIINLVGASVTFNKLEVSIKYEYYETRTHIKEVGELWDLVVKPTFANSQQIVLKEVTSSTPLKREVAKKDKGEYKPVIVEDTPIKSSYNLHLTNSDSCKVLLKIANSTLKFLNIVTSSNPAVNLNNSGYEPFLLNSIKDILKYNNIKIPNKEIYADINKTFEGWELRKITVVNNYKSLHKQTSEYLVLDFDNNGELFDVSFGIIDNLYEQFREQSAFGRDWRERLVMIKFMEKYRTAYLTRNMTTLNKIFAEEAVIIVGRLANRPHSKDMYKYLKITDEQPNFEQIQLTKKEFLDRQKNIFNMMRDIYLGFSTFKINKKNDQNGVYGLSLRQHYNSTSYSDEGYLFLLVDFNQELPQIYVRAWQPQEWDDNALVRLSNFKVNK